MKPLNKYSRARLINAVVDCLGYSLEDFETDTKATLIEWLYDNFLNYEIEDYLNA